MPKRNGGIFFKCEKSIKKFIDKMNKDEHIILKDIDENCCIISRSKIQSVLEKIELLQNQFLVEPTDLEINKK